MKHQNVALTVKVGSPLGILASGEVWVGLLEVEVARQVVKEMRMLPAQQGQPLLVTHVALVLEEKGLDQFLHGSYPDG